MRMPRPARALARLPGGLLHLAAGLFVAARLAQVDEAGRRQRVGWFARTMLRRLGVAVERQGETADEPLLVVANHVSWLDVLAIHSAIPQARFVSKADARRWPVFGWLSAAAGTLFIERERRSDAMRVVHEMTAALSRGETVAVFPEGTTSPGDDVRPLHAGLLQAPISAGRRVLPLGLSYREEGPPDAKLVDAAGDVREARGSPAAYVDINLLRSIWRVLGARRLVVRVTLLPALETSGTTRRELASRIHAALASTVRSEA